MDASEAVRAARAREFAVRIVRVLREGGHVAYFAGGCVRDELLGLHPKDYDVATDATPGRVAEFFPRAMLVGAHFGVVLVRAPGGDGIVTEVATFRADGPYSDRRRPDRVTFSDAATDAGRRDFTVNALFLDPLADRNTPVQGEAPAGGGGVHGQVVDFVGGLADLDARVLRAVGDPEARLAEDHLRALRAVRLAARLGLRIEERTAEAIARHARELAGVSRERIGDEVRKMLAHPTRAEAMRLLAGLGLDEPVLGRRAGGCGFDRLEGMPGKCSIVEALAAIALDRGEIEGVSDVGRLLSSWRSRLCLSNEERDGIRGVLRAYFEVRQGFTGLRVAAQKRLAASAGFEGAMRLVGSEDPALAGVVRSRVEELAATASGLWPAALVTGDDLVSAGYEPGPRFARVLEEVYDAQLEDRFGTREEGLKLTAEAWRRVGKEGDRRRAGP